MVDKDNETRVLIPSSSSSTFSNFSSAIEELPPGEVDWSQAICTLLPSRTTTRGVRASICPPLPPEIIHAITLPRRMTARTSAIRLDVQKLSEEKKKLPSFRRSRLSFKVGEAVDYSERAEDVRANEEDYQEQMKMICGLPVPMSVKREYRAKLQKMVGTTAKGTELSESLRTKSHMKIRETYEEFFSRWNLWCKSLKEIEGKYGTGVVSYFIFLRWLFFLNLFIFIVVLIFIILPQVFFISSQHDKRHISQSGPSTDFLHAPTRPPTSFTEHTVIITQPDIEDVDQYGWPHFASVPGNYPVSFSRKYPSNDTFEQRKKLAEICHRNYTEHLKKSISSSFSIHHVQDLLQGTGWLEYTLLFIGHYSSYGHSVFSSEHPYSMPVAFLISTMVYLLVCLGMMINYTSHGVRETLLASKAYVTKYCNMIFSGWDFCIVDQKTATLKHYSIVQEIKTHLAEERRESEISNWTTGQKIAVVMIRFAVNIVVIGVLIGCFFVIKYVTEESLIETQEPKGSKGLRSLVLQYLPSFTITFFNVLLPIAFTLLVKFEKYSKEFEVKITLMRTVFIRLASIGILVTTFYNIILCDSDKLNPCLRGLQGEDCNRPMCWETYVGQQMYKLVIMDFFVILGTTFFVETPRRLLGKCNFKLAKIIARQEFDIPSQVLAMVYSQALCWLGAFYSPMIPAFSVIKLTILFYVKKYTLLKNCVPSNIPYRASHSNTFFMIVLMITYIVTTVILGYSISEVPPSRGCGPFRVFDSMFSSLAEEVNAMASVPRDIIYFLFSAGFAIPAFSLLCLAMYYYITLASAYHRHTHILTEQLQLERKDKQFLLTRLNEVARQHEE